LGEVVVRTCHQANLTSECWEVQFLGLEACERCEFRGKRECGGKQIRKTGKNTKGIAVPIP
jgi:hypothetical protein